LAGTAISDTSSVVAAGDTFAKITGIASAAELPVIVKLTRTTFLVVVAVVFTFVMVNEKRKEAQLAIANGVSGSSSEPEKSFGKIVMDVFPWFILGFLGMAILNTFGVFPESMSPFFKKGYKFLVTTALVGVGYKINIKDLFTKGVKPMILGGITWAVVAIVAMSYVLIFM
ncbi:MAG: putative sulfate exporter family transporter, partial [Peptostreptococcaceae bacterium]